MDRWVRPCGARFIYDNLIAAGSSRCLNLEQIQLFERGVSCSLRSLSSFWRRCSKAASTPMAVLGPKVPHPMFQSNHRLRNKQRPPQLAASLHEGWREASTW